eukprot:123806-Chlamydomonas_euryale.AAC.1
MHAARDARSALAARAATAAASRSTLSMSGSFAVSMAWWSSRLRTPAPSKRSCSILASSASSPPPPPSD